jgi:predicted acylesterase/phospholipase RssA
MGNGTRRALVLAGGNFAASAWESGLLAGMASAGVDLRDSDLFIGTSAGARVALHLANGTDLNQLFEQQFKPIPKLPSPPPPDWPSIRRECAEAKAAGGSLDAILKRFGKIALKHASLTPADLQTRRDTMAAQLPLQTWPGKPVLIVAVNAGTGERRAFDRASGVSPVDAMIATTASFGASPALPLERWLSFHWKRAYWRSKPPAPRSPSFNPTRLPKTPQPPEALGIRPSARRQQRRRLNREGAWVVGASSVELRSASQQSSRE